MAVKQDYLAYFLSICIFLVKIVGRSAKYLVSGECAQCRFVAYVC
jgi:hypothetical protein